ncbi:RNA-directed DNA polymerase [Candidatus Saccharibacteria bacterium]|nr:RNA-directed DNA polymerase [Candidatus Saccharibacteria bacterium]
MKRRQRSREIYGQALTYDRVYEAWRVVRTTCKNKRELAIFAMNLQANLYSILRELREGDYRPDPYRAFMIFEPKARLVMSQSVRDKIVNHFVANNYLLPYLEQSLIEANVATRKGRGGAMGIALTKRYFHQIMVREPGKEIYALKLDISKYFYSIDHDILLKKVRRRMYDEKVLDILRRIIDETDSEYINEAVDFYNNRYGTDIPHYTKGRGLSIGAMTSQFLAIYYLSDLDHYIKEKLGCRYYVRYMDDFLILSTSKAKLRRVWRELERKLDTEYHLALNPKTAIFPCRRGFVFLGFRFRTHEAKLRVDAAPRTRRRIRLRLRELARQDRLDYWHSLASYYGYWRATTTVRRKMPQPDFRWSLADYGAYCRSAGEAEVILRHRNMLYAMGDFYAGLRGDMALAYLEQTRDELMECSSEGIALRLW